MPKDREERSYFESLRGCITGKFNSVVQDYNALQPHIQRLTQQNQAYRGAVVEGATSMISNRVNGALALYRSPQVFYRAGLSGLNWAYYFSHSNQLNDDVYDAGKQALYSHLWPLSFRGIATVAVTSVQASQGVREMNGLVRTRFEQQRNALVASAGISMGITQVFRYAGNYVQTDMQRMILRTSMRTWQITGIVGLCYGLSRLDSAMDESGVFGSNLRQRRDAFLARRPNPHQRQLEDSSDHFYNYFSP